ncbi:MAG: ornithine cyclodeaminase family protein, partial [Acidimicrobiia bacterium]
LGDDRETPQRTLVGGSLFMPGRVGSQSGVKVVSVVPGSPSGIVAVFGTDGAPLGVVDGPALTAIRTGAGCGLATDLLAPADASVMGMLGAGAMAADQVAAVRAVRPIEQVLVWSRSIEHAEALAAQLTGATAVERADEAVAAADIVTTATPSRAPLFDAASVRPGTHLNAVGAFTPEMCELPAGVVRSSFVVVDDVDAAAAEAGDLLQAGVAPDATVADLLSGRKQRGDEPTTIFKSVGIASQDVAAAVAALERAGAMGIGTEV